MKIKDLPPNLQPSFLFKKVAKKTFRIQILFVAALAIVLATCFFLATLEGSAVLVYFFNPYSLLVATFFFVAVVLLYYKYKRMKDFQTMLSRITLAKEDIVYVYTDSILESGYLILTESSMFLFNRKTQQTVDIPYEEIELAAHKFSEYSNKVVVYFRDSALAVSILGNALDIDKRLQRLKIYSIFGLSLPPQYIGAAMASGLKGTSAALGVSESILHVLSKHGVKTEQF